jgi:hypothetical protein
MNKLKIIPFIIATPLMLVAVFMTDDLYDCDSIEGEVWKNVCEERESMTIMIIPFAFMTLASLMSVLIPNNETTEPQEGKSE